MEKLKIVYQSIKSNGWLLITYCWASRIKDSSLNGDIVCCYLKYLPQSLLGWRFPEGMCHFSITCYTDLSSESRDTKTCIHVDSITAGGAINARVGIIFIYVSLTVQSREASNTLASVWTVSITASGIIPTEVGRVTIISFAAVFTKESRGTRTSVVAENVNACGTVQAWWQEAIITVFTVPAKIPHCTVTVVCVVIIMTWALFWQGSGVQ